MEDSARPGWDPEFREIGFQLTLHRSHLEDLVFDLLKRGHIEITDADEDPPALRLTADGWAHVRDAVERAGRFLPGWPPPGRTSS